MARAFSWAKLESIAELVGPYCDSELVREYVQDEIEHGDGEWLLTATPQEVADWVGAAIQESVDQRDEDNGVFMKGQGY
jgi:hypothetical protein